MIGEELDRLHIDIMELLETYAKKENKYILHSTKINDNIKSRLQSKEICGLPDTRPTCAKR